MEERNLKNYIELCLHRLLKLKMSQWRNKIYRVDIPESQQLSQICHHQTEVWSKTETHAKYEH